MAADGNKIRPQVPQMRANSKRKSVLNPRAPNA